jgi:hypothetical protein
MWDKESRRASRQAYKANRRAAREAYRAARYQYKTARRFYRMGNRGYRFLGLALFLIVVSSFFYWHETGFFITILPLAIIGAIIWQVIARNSMRQAYAPPTDQSAGQPYQASQQPYYQPSSPPPPAPPEPYQDYSQGYQVPASVEGEHPHEYRSPESYQGYNQDEQPQALYPQSLPPMEQQ